MVKSLVCVRARARVCVCVCVFVFARVTLKNWDYNKFYHENIVNLDNFLNIVVKSAPAVEIYRPPAARRARLEKSPAESPPVEQTSDACAR